MLDVWVVISVAAKTAMAAVLLYAGFAKLLDKSGFASVVEGFKLMPKKLVPSFAASLPVVEVLAGLSLLSGIFSDWWFVAWSGAVSIALFVMFGVAITINLLRGRSDISCGCFGKDNHRLTWGLVAKDSACVVVSFLTLPPFQGRLASEGLRDRFSVALVGFAVVAVAWLGRFIVTSASASFERPS